MVELSADGLRGRSGFRIDDADRRQRAIVTIARTSSLVAIIVLGVGLRRFGLSLGTPAMIVKYGGSTLWGAMVFFLVTIAMPRFSRLRIAGISTVIAAGVELLRLVHTPWLDDFRLTLLGALLLGRIFSPWDILAYVAGIGLALGLDSILPRACSAASAPHASN
jgi:hypothetical protein